MVKKAYQVVGIGNAIVDVIAHVDEPFLTENAMTKAAMMLIDEERAVDLYAKLPPATEVSGGSAANTMAALASLGVKGAFVGKVADDQLGTVFSHDMRAGGVHFDTKPLQGGPATARCLIAVTPDGERTMNTFLGASTHFSPEDVDEALISDAECVYLEGYLFDKSEAKAAFQRAAAIAKQSGAQVAITLSDTFCVERHRADFIHFLESSADIVFANEREALALAETDSFEEAVQFIADRTAIVAATRSEHGSVILAGGETAVIKPDPVAKVEDATGAGDAYAAGFLGGRAMGLSLWESGRLGSICATEAISHLGPRPQTDLRALAAQKGLSLPEA